MEQPILGIHQVTAIASDPQRNVDFYTEVLGLRLVKRTVNFDDPGTYHLYFGDETGSPGTILTFFPWPMAARGSPGVGQVEVTSFSVPEQSLGYWEQRLVSAGTPVERSGKRFDEEVLTLADPDGLKLELVADSENAGTGRAWKEASVPAQHGIRGFYSVTSASKDTRAPLKCWKRWDSGKSASRVHDQSRRTPAGETHSVLTYCERRNSIGAFLQEPRPLLIYLRNRKHVRFIRTMTRWKAGTSASKS